MCAQNVKRGPRVPCHDCSSLCFLPWDVRRCMGTQVSLNTHMTYKAVCGAVGTHICTKRFSITNDELQAEKRPLKHELIGNNFGSGDSHKNTQSLAYFHLSLGEGQPLSQHPDPISSRTLGMSTWILGTSNLDSITYTI